MSRIGCLFLVPLFFFTTRCSTTGDLPAKKGQFEVNRFSPEQKKRIYASLEESFQPYSDTMVENYLAVLANRLFIAKNIETTDPIDVELVNVPTSEDRLPQIYPVPPEKIYIETSLLRLLTFENEIAAALIFSWERSQSPEFEERILIELAKKTPNIREAMSAFTDHDEVAIEVTIDRLYKLGFDPRGLVQFFNKWSHLAPENFDPTRFPLFEQKARRTVSNYPPAPPSRGSQRGVLSHSKTIGALVTPVEKMHLPPHVQIEKLPGDASTRVYYRLLDKNNRSTILMQTDPFSESGDALPFITVQKHLASSEVPVPRILGFNAAEGWIHLEDLSDRTLLRQLQEVSSPQVERQWYEKVLDGLIHLQIHASKPSAVKNVPSFDLRFDEEKLMWEIDFAIKHFYKGYLNRNLSSVDESLIRNEFSKICRTLANEPTVFTHRDFHSRNVMVPDFKTADDARCVMIDFQDARLGPAQYDLASLLKDSYYQLDEIQIVRLLDYYMIRMETLTHTKMDRAHFIKIFDWMSLQRNFKAIGSFASFLMTRQNPGYLKYIGNTFENIRRTLLKYPEFSQLREVMFHYYYF